MGDKVSITITPIDLDITEQPRLLVKMQTCYRENNREIICQSFSVGDVEYVAQRNVYDWYQISVIGEKSQPETKVKLPNGDEISEKEYIEKYVNEKGIFD